MVVFTIKKIPTFYLKQFLNGLQIFFGEYTLHKVCWATKGAHFDIIMSVMDWVFSELIIFD